MPPTITRRRFLQAAGLATAAGACAPRTLDSSGALGRRDRPNIVVVVIDTLRVDHVYGARALTPNMDALAREGLRFTRAFPEAMPTVPARKSMLTGRRQFPFRHWHDYPGLMAMPGWTPIRDGEASFTTVLRRAGYWTAYATDNPFLGWSRSYERFRRGFDRFTRRGGQVGVGGSLYRVSDRELMHWLHPVIRSDPKVRERVLRYMANGGYWHDESRSFAARVFRDGTRLLDAAARNRPFALVVDTFEPHEPWTPPRQYLDLYGDPDYHGPEPSKPYYAPVSGYIDPGAADTVLARMRALYAAEVTMTDRWLGVFIDRLYELGLARDTVIVLVADHGILLGDHGWTGKISIVLHPELAQVPFVIVHPERRLAGQSEAYFASTHDLAPTLLAMAGVPAPRSMDGVDLASLFEGRRPPERPFAYGGYSNAHYLRSDRWALIASNQADNLKLFDLRHDPGERENLAGSRPHLARKLHGQVVERAGGKLPYYPGGAE
jgi:arylsulfatase A-like enzyme